MEKELGRLVELDTPKMNPMIANGIAVEQFKYTERFIHQVMKSVASGLPEGLTFLGFERCTPFQEFQEATKKKGVRRQYDTAHSDIYMGKYIFDYKGERIVQHVYLPFVGQAGTIKVGGSRFNISPLLTDRVISVMPTSIFIRLLRDRLTLERFRQYFMIDDQHVEVQVVYSEIYHTKAATNKTQRSGVKANCTLMHYLLCKYGFTDTFLKFGKCRPVVGGPEINRTTYPEDEWVICASTQTRPKTVSKSFYWEIPTLRVAVRRSEWTPMVQAMLGGFFYVVDHFPSRVLPQYVDTKRMWMTLLGYIIFSTNIHEASLFSDVQDHMASLDEYLDGYMLPRLADIGLPVKDLYELFAISIERFDEWITSAADKVPSMYDKEINILPFALFEISRGIVLLYFRLKAASKKGNNDVKRELSVKEIKATMNSTLSTGLIFKLIKGHNEVSTVSVPGDNMATKITAILVPQSGSSRNGNKRDRGLSNDPSRLLHASIAEVGAYSALPKSEPSGRARINPHLQIDSKGVVMRNPKWAPLLDKIQEMIKRRI